MSLPIIAVRWIEWILRKQPQILHCAQDDGAVGGAGKQPQIPHCVQDDIASWSFSSLTRYSPPFAAGEEDNCALVGAGGVFIFGMPC